ncbi:6-carboxytetrahydropterin synthase [Nocardia sp. NPDC055321]
MFTVEMRRRFRARQGLASPVWQASARPPITDASVVMSVGFGFTEAHLDREGRFVDTDALERHLDTYAEHLASATWTKLFDRRPTYEYVCLWLYRELAQHIPRILYVSLDNETAGVTTTYRP